MTQMEYSVGGELAASGIATEIDSDALYEKCMALAHNLWWSWQPEVTNLFRDIDPIRWRQLDHNPIALLREFTPDRLSIRGLVRWCCTAASTTPFEGFKSTLSPPGPGLIRMHGVLRKQASRLLLGGIRIARIAPDLLRWFRGFVRAIILRVPAVSVFRWLALDSIIRMATSSRC
jgi:hypothetical protein